MFHVIECCYALMLRHALAGNLYHSITAFFYDWLKISSAQDVSCALNRQSREFRLNKIYHMVGS